MKRALVALLASAMLTATGSADPNDKSKPLITKSPVQTKPVTKLPPKAVQSVKMQTVLKSVDLTALQRSYVESRGVYNYGITNTHPVGRLSSTQASLMTGVIFMPQIASRAQPIWRNGSSAGQAHVSGEHFSFILVAGAGRPIGLMSYRLNGDITYSLDLDRDGVVDYAEILAPGGLTITVRDGLGEQFAAAYDSLGTNAFCGASAGAKGAKAGAGKGAGSFRPPAGGASWITAPAGDWAALDLCGSTAASRAMPSVGGAGGGSARGSDPFAAMCASVGTSLFRPPQFAGRIQALDDREKRALVLENAVRTGDLGRVASITVGMGYETASAVESRVEGLAGEVVDAVDHGTAPARDAASHILGDVLRGVAERVDPSTPAEPSEPTDYSATEPAAAEPADSQSSQQEDTVACDECGREYYREHGLLTGEDDGRPDPTGLDDGAGTLPFLCRSQRGYRSEWQRVVDDQRGRNFSDCSTGPAGEPSTDRGAFCTFLNSALNRIDPLSVGGFGVADAGTGRGAIDTPESAIQARFAAVQRTGLATVFTCDPAICQPLPVQ